MTNKYRIADLNVEMGTFGRTLAQAEPYRCEFETADVTIASDWQNLKSQQPHLSEDDCEYISTGGYFYWQLLNFDGLLLHASAVVVDGRAYLFSAPSGTGKSTHTGLWLRLFGDRAVMLNDDKPALRLKDGVWYAYGTPWSGKYDINVNMGVPLAGIAMIEQSPVNEIVPFTGAKAVMSILDQTLRPANKEQREKLMDLVVSLLSEVRVWKLKCNMDPEAAIVSYEAMSGEKWRK